MKKWLIHYRGFVIEKDNAPWVGLYRMDFMIYPIGGAEAWLDEANNFKSNIRFAPSIPEAKKLIDEIFVSLEPLRVLSQLKKA